MKSRIVLFAFCLALLSSCGNKGNDTGKVPEYAVQELQKTTADLMKAYPATIKGRQDVEIRPQVSGFITKLCVDEGATVRKGQLLFIVDPTQYEAAVRTAKAAVATAEAAVNTQQMTVDNKIELNKKQIISDYDLSMAKNSLAQAQAQLAQAKAQLTTAQQNYSFTQVKSPSDGVINDIPYRLGALVSPSMATPMTTVSEIDEVYVYFSMTEKELLAMTKTGGTIKEEISKYQSAPVSENKFISSFLRYRNIQVLTREVIVELIEMIYVHEGGTITIQFKYQDEYQRLLDLIDEQGLASAAG